MIFTVLCAIIIEAFAEDAQNSQPTRPQEKSKPEA
jgi:hypothetical protein